MGQRRSKIFLLETLSVGHLFLAFLLRLWGSVHYARPGGCLANPEVIARLDNFGIKILNYDNASEYIIKNHSLIQARVANLVFEEIFSPDSRFDVLRNLFMNIENFDQKFRIVIQMALQGYLGYTPELMLWAEHFKKDGEVILVSSNLFISVIARNARFGFGSFYPSGCWYLFMPFQFAAWFLKKGWIRLQKVLAKPSATAPLRKSCCEVKESDLSKYSVLFFPHKGVAYTGLFTKSHYYSNDPRSPFYDKNMLHVETHGFPPDMTEAQRRDIVDFNIDRELPFYFLSPQGLSNKLRPALQFGRFLVDHLADMLALARRHKLFAFILLSQIYSRYRFYLQSLDKMQNARVAVVGYDQLFPKTLALALGTLNIVTVAVQERYQGAHQTAYGVILDHYLVASEYIKHTIEKNPTFACASMKAIGQIRVDKIYEFQRNCDPDKELKRISELKRERRIVLALDFHSVETVMENFLSLFDNWRYNAEFYLHLIKLAAEFTDVHFIIRGKSDTWTRLDYFKEVYQRIKATPNMEVHQNYEEYDLSYKLAAVADCVIAKHTSLAEEALAAKIPVLVHDICGQSTGAFNKQFNPMELPIYVNSYEELSLKLREILNGESFFHGEKFEEKICQLYGNFFDGKVQYRAHEELRRIYEEAEQTKEPDYKI